MLQVNSSTPFSKSAVWDSSVRHAGRGGKGQEGDGTNDGACSGSIKVNGSSSGIRETRLDRLGLLAPSGGGAVKQLLRNQLLSSGISNGTTI